MYIYIHIYMYIRLSLSLYIYISSKRVPAWCESFAFRYTCMVAPLHLLCAIELLGLL